MTQRVTDARMREFALPDLGEGLTEGEILQWLVAPGDTVRLNQPLVEVETAKAAVEIPSPFAGVVQELLVEAGATVDVGAAIVRFDTDPAAGPTTAVQPPDGDAPGGADLVPPAATREPVGAGREAVLVGYGVRPGATQRRPRQSSPAGLPGASGHPSATPAADVAPPARVSAAAVAGAAQRAAVPPARPLVLAKPPVRRLAKDLGVQLLGLAGSGPGGVVTRADVQAAAATDAPEQAPAATGSAPQRLGSGAPRRAERRIPVAGVRRATARAMVASAFTAPHVTLFHTVDVTRSSELLRRLRALPDLDGVHLGPLLLVARALLVACRRHPEVNARWDEEHQEIVIHGGVNLGVAAATPRGLLVPNVKDADTLSLVQLAHALEDLTTAARAGRTAPADLSGGTITLTNVGTFGVDTGTPILNPGEAAILCLGAIRPQPWVHEGSIVARDITTLALSFDHRLVDGQLGAQVLADVGAVLADPELLIAWS